MSSMANGSRPGRPAPPVETRIWHVFAWGVRDRDGQRELIIERPNGEVVILPFTPDKAQELGASLMAPSIVRPGVAG